MSYRCINAFAFGDKIYPGGLQVDDTDPILVSHVAHFARVGEAPASSTEVASAAPEEKREARPAPAKQVPAKPAAPKPPVKDDTKGTN